MTKDQPNNTSSDYDAMKEYWAIVDAILGGAKTMRAAGKSYLPKHKDEPQENYDVRLKNAKFVNVFRDITENLSQRPFGKQATISEGASTDIEDLAENVDAKGSSLHVFSAARFFDGINYGIDWILVDYTKDVPEGATVADEKRIGARPYWVHYPATSVLAAYSAQIGGEEQFVHVRLNEPQKRRVGFKEETVERVRIIERPDLGEAQYGPAQFEIWEKRQDEKSKKEEWISVEGPTSLSIGVIPLVPFLTGRRIGKSWRVHPPMQDAAYLQIELYQELSGLKHAKDLTCFPMLTASGVSPPIGGDGKPTKVPVGPHAVLYAPPSDGVAGEWKFIEPSAQSLEFLAKDIKETIKELRELGRQPLTAQSGNLTVITTAVAAKKGNAAIQDWALSLKDALENAFKFTAMWLKAEGQEPDVNIDTDFDLGWDQNDGFDYLISMHDNGDISHSALIDEAKRRNYLRPDFDADGDIQQMLDEMSSEGEDGDT